jgi:hypothetical protein
MTHKFEELVLDGHNYPIWTMDVKISLALRGMYVAIVLPTEREQALPYTSVQCFIYYKASHTT